MSVQLLKKPEKAINGHLSKWNAAHQPIEFQLQRQDSSVVMKYKYSSPGALVRIKLSSNVPSGVQVGQKIFYQSPNGSSYNWTILEISGNVIGTNGTISGTVYGGFVNFLDARRNYFIETQIYFVNSSNAFEYLGTARHRVDEKGIANVNIQRWIKTACVYENTFKYNAINKAIAGEGGKFSIRIQENYNNQKFILGPFLSLGYWTNSAQQVLSKYGSNMGEYVPTLDASRPEKAKFLTSFKRPTYFKGYPFSISFIYSDNLSNLQVIRKESQRTINDQEVVLNSDNVNPTQRFFVNRLMLKGDYPSSVKKVNLWLETGAILTASNIEYSSGYSNGDIFAPFDPVERIKPVSVLL